MKLSVDEFYVTDSTCWVKTGPRLMVPCKDEAQ